MRKFIVGIALLGFCLLLVFFTKPANWLHETSGIVESVEFTRDAGGIFTPGVYLTVVKFRDGRIKTFSTIIDGLVIGKKCEIYKHPIAEWRRVEYVAR